MIFFLYFLLILAPFSDVKSQDSCPDESVEEPSSSNSRNCSDGFIYFYRTPTPKNHHTSGWCLKLIKTPENVSQKDAQMTCEQYGAQLSIFENHGEEHKFFGALPTDLKGTNFRIDGYRKENCKTDHDIGADPDCNKGSAFLMKSPYTDPTYQLNNFGSIDPNYQYKKPDRNEESCLVLSQGEAFKVVDLSCMADLPYWEVRAVLCGKKPI